MQSGKRRWFLGEGRRELCGVGGGAAGFRAAERTCGRCCCVRRRGSLSSLDELRRGCWGTIRRGFEGRHDVASRGVNLESGGREGRRGEACPGVMSAPLGGEGERRRQHHGPHRHRHEYHVQQQWGNQPHQQQRVSQQQHRRRGRGDGDLVPLAALISRELKSEKMERPKVRFGCAAQSKKGEDYFLMKEECQRVPGSTSSTFSVFAIFDGHNGNAAAIFAKENLLSHILSAIPRGLGREEWLHALPRALVAGFVKTDKEFQSGGETSGTTATFVIVDRWTVTVASVGDSRCILDTQDGAVTLLTVDHRLEENAEERERVTVSGGEVGRLSILGGAEIGPLRCWPGGLCLSRSIGDMDVGEFIVPVPYVKQVKLSSAGGRLILASDGIWDALSSEMAAKSCRGLPAELAAKQVVKEALRTRGLKDDTTCIVVDIIPPDHPLPPPSPPKRQNKLKSFFFRKSSNDSASKLAKRLSVVGIVEELFEEGSAMLSERLGNETSTSHATPGLFTCAICQVDLAPSEGFSVHAGAIFSTSAKPWQGPFLCATCRDKKDAMEGKRPSGVKVV